MATEKKPAAKTAKTAAPKAEKDTAKGAAHKADNKVAAKTAADKKVAEQKDAKDAPKAKKEVAAAKVGPTLEGNAKTPRLQLVYDREIVPALKAKYGYKNVMQVPRLEKIVINMGVGEAVADQKQIISAVEEMTLIAGQKPVITKAKKAEASFKLRAGLLMKGADIALFVNNLLDDHPALGRFHAFSGDPLYLNRTIQPRTFGLSLTYHY